MIVAHVGSIAGGAGIAALKVHHALRRSGVASEFFAIDATAALPADEVIGFPRRVAPRNSAPSLLFRLAVKMYSTGRPRDSGLFSYTSLPVDSPFPFDVVRPDVIHLHWIAEGIDYRTFFDSIPSSLPIVWTLLDMEPFTGGCHYAGACVRFQQACGWCPQLNALRNPADLSAVTFRRKRKRFARLNLTVVGVATASIQEAQRAPLFAGVREFQVIPIGIDTSAFAPRDPAASRATLGLSTDRVVIAFGAVDLGSIYKGFNVLLDALARLRNRDRVLLLLFGGALPPNVSPPLGPWHHAGFEHDPARLAAIYSAADVLVVPSVSEALGQVGLEALACGTPVVGSRVGGVPDYVLDGVTGLLFDPADADDLAAKLDWIIEHPEARRQYGAAGPPLVRERFSIEVVNRSHQALYERLTTRSRDSSSSGGRPALP